MGIYNPDTPFILGNEFAGIRNEVLDFEPGVDSVETGYSFTTTASRTLQDARIYAQEVGTIVTPQVPPPICINIYPKGREAASGPIQRVVIPMNQGFWSGDSNMVVRANGTNLAAGTAPNANFAPVLQGWGDNTINWFESATQSNFAYLYFNVDSVAQQLSGKRILAVNMLIRIYGDDAQAAADGTQLKWGMTKSGSVTGVGEVPLDPILSSTLFTSVVAPTQRIPLGSVTRSLTSALLTFAPWTLASLSNFQGTAAAGSRVGIYINRQQNFGTVPSVNTGYRVDYVALEVIYCEEQRVAIGVAVPTFSGAIQTVFGLPFGAWTVPMLTPAGAANPVLTTNTSYTVTASLAEYFDRSDVAFPDFNAVRTLYELPVSPGIQVNKPFPVYNAVGQVFSSQDNLVLPQLTLHTSSGVLPESQVYGNLVAAPVFDSVPATQTVDQTPVGATNYTMTRFYARYFGSPESALVCTRSGGTPTCTVTQAMHDALPGIIDGWKEVTLPLSAATNMGGAGVVTWAFTSTGTTIGNRWEVLGVMAPALTGFAGSYKVTVPAAQVLDSATYLSPSGATADLTWHSPAVSGTGEFADTTSDLVLMFSQAPALPGFIHVNVLSQALTGVGTLCGQTAPNVPTALSYIQITWQSPGLTGSGFGYYELQRLDAVDNTWNTVMQCATQGQLTYNDYEARVGILTTYQIRVVNALGFAGAWLQSLSATVPTPGVTVTRSGGNSVLIFTSNNAQLGERNMAYSMSWNGDVSEDLTFPEQSRQTLQFMYGKNFMTAFTPLERGGEQFTRTLLFQLMSVTGPVIEAGFRSMRDLAWASLPYVCVRNELGDRWYANVQVPGATLQKNRTIQLVQVQITEVSTVPAIVDPALSQ